MQPTTQQRAALDLANARRFQRADIKDAAHADGSWLTLLDLVNDWVTPRTAELEREALGGMKVKDLLLAVPGIGRYKVGIMLRQVGAPADVTFDELGARRRRELAVRLLRNRSTLNDRALERIAARPRVNRSERTAA